VENDEQTVTSSLQEASVRWREGAELLLRIVEHAEITGGPR